MGKLNSAARLAYVHRRDRRLYRKMVSRLQSEMPEAGLPAPTTLSQTLASQRGRLDDRPHVVIFGANKWERYGLWPSWGRAADVSFFDYSDSRLYVPGPRGQMDGPATRARIKDQFLRFVRARDEKKRVVLAFFYASGWHIDSDLLGSLSAMGIWTVVMSLDDKHQFFRPMDASAGISHQERVALACDLYWTSWPLAAAYVTARGSMGWYAPSAADPSFYYPIEGLALDRDVVFMGAAYGYRKSLVRGLRSAGVRIDTFGSGWPSGFVDHEAALRLISSAKVVLGVGGVGALQEVAHLKGRDFEVPMAGGTYLTSYNPELADHFTIGQDIVCYSSWDQCAELCHQLIRSPISTLIGEAGRRRAMKSHTWDERLRNLFQMLRGD